MRKLREDSTWSGLTGEQRQKLEGWLFERNLGYAEALKRAHKEFGVQASATSLGRFYQRRAQERQQAALLEAQSAATELNGLPVKVDSLRDAAMKLIGHFALKQAIEKPGQLEPLMALTKLLLESRQNDLRQGRLKLAEQYFHYEATAASRKDLPQLGAYLKAIQEDDSLKAEAKLEKVKQLLYPGERAKSGEQEKDNSENGK
jgi:hypothetical protein